MDHQSAGELPGCKRVVDLWNALRSTKSKCAKSNKIIAQLESEIPHLFDIGEVRGRDGMWIWISANILFVFCGFKI